jgi:hypothetical protein
LALLAVRISAGPPGRLLGSVIFLPSLFADERGKARDAC